MERGCTRSMVLCRVAVLTTAVALLVSWRLRLARLFMVQLLQTSPPTSELKSSPPTPTTEPVSPTKLTPPPEQNVSSLSLVAGPDSSLTLVVTDMPVSEYGESAPPPPTLCSILSSDDLCPLVVEHLDLGGLAAIQRCMRPRHALRNAAVTQAARIVAAAPLHCASGDFAEEALWPIDVAAADWHPRPFFAELRAPAYCRVVGSGRCSHGLCQKQETAREGVLELLEEVGATAAALAAVTHARRGHAPECVAAGSRQQAAGLHFLALECVAWLLGALGRRDGAMHAWGRAAAAGSVRAQVDIALRTYRRGTASTVYYASGAGAEPTESRAAAMLERALDSPCLGGPRALSLFTQLPSPPPRPTLGVEGYLIRARALLHMGMMALDGDGVQQSDDVAANKFLEAVAQGAAMHYEQCHDQYDDATVTPPSVQSALDQVGEEARECLRSMDRFTYFANGRP